jgi:threonine synthase
MISSFLSRSAQRFRGLPLARSLYSESDAIFVNEAINDPETRARWKTEPLPISFEDISRAQFSIRSGVNQSHCDYSPALSELCETEIYLKKDFAHRTGSFKERGARNALLCLSDESKERGVVCASAGNHAQAMVSDHALSVRFHSQYIDRLITAKISIFQLPA